MMCVLGHTDQKCCMFSKYTWSNSVAISVRIMLPALLYTSLVSRLFLSVQPPKLLMQITNTIQFTALRNQMSIKCQNNQVKTRKEGAENKILQRIQTAGLQNYKLQNETKTKMSTRPVGVDCLFSLVSDN